MGKIVGGLVIVRYISIHSVSEVTSIRFRQNGLVTILYLVEGQDTRCNADKQIRNLAEGRLPSVGVLNDYFPFLLSGLAVPRSPDLPFKSL